jgi:hypothetical protein
MTIPSDSPKGPQGPDLSHYKPQYKIDVNQWRKFLKFHNTQLTDNEVHAMADGMIKFLSDFMNRLMQHALQAQKDREQEEKETREG